LVGLIFDAWLGPGIGVVVVRKPSLAYNLPLMKSGKSPSLKPTLSNLLLGKISFRVGAMRSHLLSMITTRATNGLFAGAVTRKNFMIVSVVDWFASVGLLCQAAVGSW